MSMLEAECTRCGGIFVPHGVTPEDLIHGEWEETNTVCGGIGVIQGAWGKDMPMVDFNNLLQDIIAMENHGKEMPHCDDPDCEFHHPEVREHGGGSMPKVYYDHDQGRCLPIPPTILRNDSC